MKTLKNWLYTLPKDIKEKAIIEIKKEWATKEGYNFIMNFKSETLKYALAGSFIFDDFDYWNNVIEKYSK